MIIFATTSETRQNMLKMAGVTFIAKDALVDEEVIRETMLKEGEKPRDIADCLAEAKARKISMKHTGLVLAADQVCAMGMKIFSKPKSEEELKHQLKELSGKQHMLYSAAVIYKDGAPIWRFIGEARLVMRNFSDDFLNNYIHNYFSKVKNCAGGYQIEGVGAQLFDLIEGDYFTILGLPLLPVLECLRQHGELRK